MKKRGTIAVSSLTFAAAILVAAGCDQASLRRTEALDRIAEAGREFHVATAAPVSPGDDAFEQTRRTLDQIARDVLSIDAEEAAQQAAVALLAAAIHREIALLDTARTEQFESEHSELRYAITNRIDAAMRLGALASGREMTTTANERALLAEERASAERDLHEHSQAMALLDGPISEREAQNRSDTQEADRLESQAGALRREAAELGHEDGLDRFEEAIRLERDADQYRYRVAQRENDLRHELRPQHGLAATRAKFLQSMIQEISEAETTLEARDQAGQTDASAIRQLIQSFGTSIDESMNAIGDSTAGELQEAYQQAHANLDKAATQAKKAAAKSPRGESDAARILAARILANQGQLYLARSRQMTDQITVLDRLVEAEGRLGSVDRFVTERDALGAAYDDAGVKAKAAFTSAKEQLGQVRGNAGTEVEEFKRVIDMNLAMMTGETTS